MDERWKSGDEWSNYKSFFFFLIYFSIPCRAQYNIVALNALKAEIKKLKSDKDLEHAIWGITVKDLKADQVLVEYNSHTGLIPASSLKTVTTATALMLFGADYSYQTYLQYDGMLDTVNGVLYGNLYIKGSGDPSLDSKYFYKEGDSVSAIQKWAAVLKAKNIINVLKELFEQLTFWRKFFIGI